MLCFSLFIGFIVIVLKPKTKEVILPWNKHIKSWQKIKQISDLPTLMFFRHVIGNTGIFRPTEMWFVSDIIMVTDWKWSKHTGIWNLRYKKSQLMFWTNTAYKNKYTCILSGQLMCTWKSRKWHEYFTGTTTCLLSFQIYNIVSNNLSSLLLMGWHLFVFAYRNNLS